MVETTAPVGSASWAIPRVSDDRPLWRVMRRCITYLLSSYVLQVTE